MHQLVVFASGKGSNVQAILDYFQSPDKVRIALIVCNNPEAGVLDIAKTRQIPVQLIDRNAFRDPGFVEKLRSYSPSLLVLAGFLWKVPDNVVQAFPGRIINIHPALLPKYGGKGMYGQHVHQAVVAAGEKESGITIHYVNEHYDEGGAILQARCTLVAEDTHESLASRIHKLEHYFFPRTIEFLLDNLTE
ncbi:phosphoribosylglycinamide formyltransferase [Taibaiella helva]|uniref:phosphoribosylglycinamide formyltransferase n=1 Tax=Taibaiella helva TaxID=2301235 RepID=UPI000E57007B|nr:phosphoribosylglycinamide formyltransferase [Taibaiella helva]